MAKYVCPMHPGETSEDSDVHCSKCGMTLEATKESEETSVDEPANE